MDLRIKINKLDMINIIKRKKEFQPLEFVLCLLLKYLKFLQLKLNHKNKIDFLFQKKKRKWLSEGNNFTELSFDI